MKTKINRDSFYLFSSARAAKINRNCPYLFSSGFTLVEILLAISISAVILIALGSTLDALSTSERSINASETNERVARILMDRLERELISVDRDTAISGRDNQLIDEITIPTLAYETPKTVRYFWNEKTLMREEIDPTLIENPKPIAIPGVTDLGLRYSNGAAWSDAWTTPAAPAGVAIQIKVDGTLYGSIVAL